MLSAPKLRSVWYALWNYYARAYNAGDVEVARILNAAWEQVNDLMGRRRVR